MCDNSWVRALLQAERSNIVAVALEAEASVSAEAGISAAAGASTDSKPEAYISCISPLCTSFVSFSLFSLSSLQLTDMAETAGLVVGVVALANLFNNTVECSDFVQLGRTSREDFQTSQIKPDSTEYKIPPVASHAWP
jgi:hypothetical protein